MFIGGRDVDLVCNLLCCFSLINQKFPTLNQNLIGMSTSSDNRNLLKICSHILQCNSILLSWQTSLIIGDKRISAVSLIKAISSEHISQKGKKNMIFLTLHCIRNKMSSDMLLTRRFSGKPGFYLHGGAAVLTQTDQIGARTVP